MNCPILITDLKIFLIYGISIIIGLMVLNSWNDIRAKKLEKEKEKERKKNCSV